MKYIGITGGVGSGKSRVLSWLEENCSCRVLRSDDLAAQMMKKGGSLWQIYRDILGDDILDAEGEIDRPKTAAILFRDPGLLQEVNRRTHPPVRSEIERQREAAELEGKAFFFLESAVLIEEKYNEICDELWYVYADADVRRRRLKQQRGYTDARIDAMLKNQQDDSVFRNACDFTIDNSGDFRDTERQLLDKLSGLKAGSSHAKHV